MAPAYAALTVPEQRQECELGAFVSETDSAGLSVRSGPGTRFPIIGHLPPVATSADDPSLRAMAEVTVKASESGWFLISDVRDNEMLTEAAPRAIFAGSGWVNGSGLTVKSQAERGYISPDIQTETVLSAHDMTLDSDELIQAGKLKACAGEWALVEFGPLRGDSGIMPYLSVGPAAREGARPGAFRAWVNKICALQETGCDGL